jgi:hypothetical protein
MRNAVILAILTLLAGFSHRALAQEPAPHVKTQTKPTEPTEGTIGWLYWGTVKELTKDSMTVECWGEKPKKFAVSETLAAGKVPKEPRLRPDGTKLYDPSTADMYRLTDVKVGDWVMILYARLGGVDICDHIRITKRPGGLVPPLPEEADWLASIEGKLTAKARASMSPATLAKIREMDAQRIRYHERQNAYWDLEDKGIPYPERLGPFRRFPTAPMPRELKLGPAISP